jgi:hypothetical protein
MKHRPESQLSRALDDSHDVALVEQSLALTLAEVRRGRRRRRLTSAASVGAVGAILIVLAVARVPGKPKPAPGLGGVRPTESATPREPMRIQEITEDELLAFFPNQAVGFATINGRREFIVLPESSEP